MSKGLLITPEAVVTEVKPKNGTDFSLEELQEKVGGHIEVVELTPKTIMVVNEEGKGSLFPNMMATIIAKSCYAIFPDDYIAGNAVLCANDMVK
jgi:hypothetical protein